MLVESEKNKFEMQELKQKKKDLVKKKKAARIVAEKRRADERLERDKVRQVKDQ